MSGDIEATYPVLYDRNVDLDLAFRRKSFTHSELEELGRSVDPTAVYVEGPESTGGRGWYGGLVFRRDGAKIAVLFPGPFDASYEVPVEVRSESEVAPATLDALLNALSRGLSQSTIQH